MKEFKLVVTMPAALRSAPYVVLVVLCATLLTIGAVFYLWQRYQFISLGYEVSRLRQEKARLERAIEPLEVEAAYLSRLERLEALARTQLKMRPPRTDQVIVLEPSTHPSEEGEKDVPSAAAH